jgi:hypothetical protein
MRKRLLFIVSAAALVGWLALTIQPSFGVPEGQDFTPVSYSWSEMREIYRQERKLEEVRLAYLRFADKLDSTKKEILAGRLTLDEGAEVLVEAAERDNPGFLRRLEAESENLTPHECVVQVLLAHFRNSAELGGMTPRQREVWKGLRG